MPRNCVNSANNFCYICGEVTFAAQKKNISATVKKAYHLYFGCKIGDQDKDWAPHVCCRTCAVNLSQWLNGKRKAMPFAVPMIWRSPPITLTTVISVWYHQLLEASPRRRSGQLNTLTYHLLCDLSLMAKDSQFQNLLQIFLSVQTMRMAMRRRVLLNVAVRMMTFRALTKHLHHIKLPRMK